MRKEFRIGLGIGGVLLAVLVVAVVVHSHLKRKAQEANAAANAAAVDKTDTDVTPTPPPDSTGVISTDPSGPPAVAPTPSGTIPSEPPNPHDTNDPFRENGSDEPKTTSSWDKILLDGAMPPTTPTVTPTAGHATERTIGTHFGPATPGTFPPTPMVAVDTQPRTPSPAESSAHSAGTRTHVIAQGETFSTIARTVYGNKKYYLQIEKANPNVVPERLRPGTTIVLPELPVSGDHADHRAAHSGAIASSKAVDSDTQYVIKPNDSLYRISMHLYGTPNKVDAIYDLNKDLIGPDRGRLKLGMTLRLPLAPTSGSR